MNAGQAAKLVAQFIDKSYPADKDAIFDVIKLACNKAHQTGSWHGTAAEFFIKTFRDQSGRRHIITPKSHNILLAATIGDKRPMLRDKQYMFHRNNYGDAHMIKPSSWNTDIIDLGIKPTMGQYDFPATCSYLIGVRALGTLDANNPGFVYVEGIFDDSRPIYTYQTITSTVQACQTGCSLTNESSTELVMGLKFPITEKLQYYTNISVNQIRSITKNHTNVPVEVVAIHENGNVDQIAVLEPYETQSKYREYLVPDSCCLGDVAHLLCKISEQEDLTAESQSVIINSDEAMIALCRGIHLMYYKGDPAAGSAYINQGVSVLEGQKRQQEPISNMPIQVEFMGGHNDIPEIIQRFN